MPKKFTTEYQPERKPRGKAKRTLILEALERAGQSQEDFYDLLVERALNPDDSFAFTELWKRFHPIEKATFPFYEFDLPTGEDATKLKQADSIIKAISEGSMESGGWGRIMVTPINEMVSIGIKLLLERINSSDENLFHKIVLKPDLIVRNSTLKI